MSSKGNEIYSMFVRCIRDELLTELEQEIEELQTIAKKYYIAAEENEGEEYFDGRWRMAGEILNIIRSKKGGA